MQKTLEVNRWLVRIVTQGDNYGHLMQLVNTSEHPLVEFYDMRYDSQFVSRYNAETLLDNAERLMHRGLDLQGDVPEWKASPNTMRQVINWLNQELCI